MDEPRDGSGIRVLAGAGALDRFGEEAAALGSRALVVSPARPEPRQGGLARRLGDLLQAARVGHHPFPRAPRPGARLDGCIATAAEAARESRCRMVIGVGDAEALDAARAVSAAALLPCLLVPTAVGYGRVLPSDRFPLPDVILFDPQATAGSPPRRTAALGLQLFTGLMERYAMVPPEGRSAGSVDLPDEDASAALEDGMRGLVDRLPAAVAGPDDLDPRQDLARAAARAAEGIAVAGRGPAPLEDLSEHLVTHGMDRDAARAALLPALMSRCGGTGTLLSEARVARFGRQVLGIRETDDGRAASWAAGGARQWVRNLGFGADLPPETEIPQAVRAALRGNTEEGISLTEES